MARRGVEEGLGLFVLAKTARGYGCGCGCGWMQGDDG